MINGTDQVHAQAQLEATAGVRRIPTVELDVMKPGGPGLSEPFLTATRPTFHSRADLMTLNRSDLGFRLTKPLAPTSFRVPSRDGAEVLSRRKRFCRTSRLSFRLAPSPGALAFPPL
jgi:hypothetical protein